MKYTFVTSLLSLVVGLCAMEEKFYGQWSMALEESDKTDNIVAKNVTINDKEIRIVMVRGDKNNTKVTIKIKTFEKDGKTKANYMGEEITVTLKEVNENTVTMDFGLGKIETLKR
jgi:hypothetical protein